MKFSRNIIVYVVFSIGLLIRLFLSTSAHHGDLNNNISWGEIAVEKGLNGFYGSGRAEDWPYSAPNQPPLTILLFSGTTIVWRTLNVFFWRLNNFLPVFPSKLVWFWEGKGVDFMVKLPSILADVGIGWVIYQYLHQNSRKKYLRNFSPLIVASIWLFNPVTWYNSSVWGQTDSIVNLLGILAVLNLLSGNFLKFSFWLTSSFLFKASLGIFIPVLVFLVYKQRYQTRKILGGVFVSLVFIFLAGFWFHPKPDIYLWLLNLYSQRILPGEIGFLTAGAFNFWWLVGGRNILDSVFIYGLSVRSWGIIIALTGISLVINWLKRVGELSASNIFTALSLSALVAFLLLTRMHSRYLYPVFPYLTILLGSIPGLFYPFAVLSIVHLFNLYFLFWVPPIPVLESMLSRGQLQMYLSLINLVVLLWLLRLFKTSKI